ncbi:Hydroxymethylpyrimidine phosphate kinase ThiD [hydrothermal vent metagenome]|uniref:Hydroxymethylpyrimidine phosphate kinase ThiD n=1 Tax=hydrothermal vent metagenome TaxID=652676 RepID=A0A3B0YDB9_9ZZZZ
MSNNKIPSVLVISGLDPSGGAGIQADIEAIASHGCHPCPVVTNLTCQNTHDIQSFNPVNSAIIEQQVSALISDVDISAIKIGMIGSIELIYSIRDIIKTLPDIPVILDPVLSSGPGTAVSDTRYVKTLAQELLSLTNILTPNHLEAQMLANVLGKKCKTPHESAQVLLAQNTQYVFITGGHMPGEQLCNSLYQADSNPETFRWQRLPGEYHGSGCTLSASIAGLVAQNKSAITALLEAQEYTWQSLKHAYSTGSGQLMPNRLFWAQHE